MKVWKNCSGLGSKVGFKDSIKRQLGQLKNFCLKTVYTGAKKLVSNNLSIEFYNQLVDGKPFIFLEQVMGKDTISI